MVPNKGRLGATRPDRFMHLFEHILFEGSANVPDARREWGLKVFHNQPGPLLRREFLQLCGVFSAGLALGACTSRTAVPSSTGSDSTSVSRDKSNSTSLSHARMPLAMQRGVEKDGWRILGPGGGGAMYIPTIKPDDPDTALVACDMTGAYITHNGGQTWKQINFKVWVGAFAFDPAQPNTIYTGATGLYRSRDTGRTWQLVFPDPAAVKEEQTVGDHADHFFVSSDNWPGGKVEAIAVDPGDSQRIFIGINKGNLLLLFGTADGGQRWTELTRLEGNRILKALLDPVSPAQDRRLYFLTDAGLFEFTSQANAVESLPLLAASEISDLSGGLNPDSGQFVLYVTSPGKWEAKRFLSGAYRSLDQGRTWEALNTGLEADLVLGRFRNLNRVAACPSDARTVYLSAVEPDEESSQAAPFGIFKSQDLGQSWEWALRIGQKQPPNRSLGWIEKDYTPTWGGAPFWMSVAPANPAVCYATDWGTTYRTEDGGKTWHQLYCEVFPDGSVSTRGLDVTNSYEISFDPFDPAHLALAFTDIGAFHSHNGGKSWSHSLQGVPAQWANTCYRLTFDPQVKGRAWAAWSNCHDMPRPKMFKSEHFDQFPGGITRSDDGLGSWHKSSYGLPAQCVPTDLLIDPKSPPVNRTLYTALVGKGVYKSSDGGRSWSPKNQGILGNLNAWRLVLLPDGGLFLLICRGLEGTKVTDGALYKSSDGAETWQPVRLPDGVNFPNDFCFDPTEPRRVYLAAWPAPVEGIEQHGGLWRSETGGLDWVNIFAEPSHVYGVSVDPRQSSTVILTNFEGGVYRSEDRGEHWQRLAGYDFKWAKQPIFDPYNPDMLYLTTFGSSVWYGSAQKPPRSRWG